MSRIALVEDQLRAAEHRGKWLRFWRLTGRVGIAGCTIFLLLGGLMVREILTDKHLAIATFLFTCVGLFVTWLVMALNLVAGDTERSRLAAELEHSNPDLFDRVNTLVHLEGAPAAAGQAFFQPIALQAQRVINEHSPALPYSSRGAWGHMGALLAAVVASVWFFQAFDPWSRLRAAAVVVEEPAPPGEVPLELGFPTNTVVEMEQPWAEVRIVEPARDLTIQRTGSVALHLEAAASSAITNWHWRSVLNAGDERVHPLPPPEEPRFAAWSGEIRAPELRLQDWDVLTYFARAHAEQSGRHESEVYFLEVQPPPEVLDGMRAGGSSQCYDFLSELTGLIREQQRVIRETRRQARRPLPAEGSPEWRQLADTEQELAESVELLRARMVAAFGDERTGPVAADLKQARGALESAAPLLRHPQPGPAGQKEREALVHLSFARQHFQRIINQNPDGFRDPESPEQPDPHQTRRLADMAEFQDVAKAARDFVEQTRAKQEKIAADAKRNTTTANRKRLAAQERKLSQEFEEFRQKHPRPFGECGSQTGAAGEAMKKAEQALNGKSTSLAQSVPADAAKKLEELKQALDELAAGRRLEEAFQLKEMLDEQIGQLGQCEKPGAGGMGGDQVRQLTGNAKNTLQQLKRAADTAPAGDRLGDSLKPVLDQARLDEMKRQLDQAANAPGESERGEAASRARQGMQEVSDAFENGLPAPLKLARAQDALKPGEGPAGDGPPGAAEPGQLAELRRRLAGARKGMTPGQQQELDAMMEALSLSLAGKGAGGETAAIALLLEGLKDAEPVDTLRLQQLLERVRKFNAELKAKDGADQAADLRNINPDKLPPAYRGRIQEYFRKLSEERK